MLDGDDTTDGSLSTPDSALHQLEVLSAHSALAARIAAAEALTSSEERPSLDQGSVVEAALSLTEGNRDEAARRAGSELTLRCLRSPLQSLALRRRLLLALTRRPLPEHLAFRLTALDELTDGGSSVEGLQDCLSPVYTDWLQHQFTQCTRARKSRKAGREKLTEENVVDPERCLGQLFDFITAALGSGETAAEGEDLVRLMRQLMLICKQTTSPLDLYNSILLIRKLTNHHWLSNILLREVVQTLCNIYYSVKQMRGHVVDLFDQLLQKQSWYDTIMHLLQTLQTPPDHSTGVSHRQRGALMMVDRLMSTLELRDFVRPVMAQALAAIIRIQCFGDSRLEAGVVGLFLVILQDPELVESLVDLEWEAFRHAILHFFDRARAVNTHEDHQPPLAEGFLLRHEPKSSRTQFASGETEQPDGRELVSALSQSLETLADSETLGIRGDLMEILSFSGELSSQTSMTVIGYYAARKLNEYFSPTWQTDCRLVIENFVKSRRSSEVRVAAIRIIREAHGNALLAASEESLNHVVISALAHSHFEADPNVYESLVDLLVQASMTKDGTLYRRAVGCLRDKVLLSRLQHMASSFETTSYSTTSHEPAPKEQFSVEKNAVEGLARIFARELEFSGSRSVLVYGILVEIIGTAIVSSEARLEAFQFLLCLRADGEDRIYLWPSTDKGKEEIDPAQALLNSKKSQTKLANTAFGQRTSIDSSDASGSTSQQEARQFEPEDVHAPLVSSGEPDWSLVKPRMQEHEVSASSRIASAYPVAIRMEVPGLVRPPPQSEIKDPCLGRVTVSDWLVAVMLELQNGQDWKTKDCLMRHLSDQLSNVSLFKYSKPAITHLLNVICLQIRNGNLLAAPAEASLQRPDAVACMYRIVSSLIPYHHVFGKHEIEELVKTLARGIGTHAVASRVCIQALSMCCFELPEAVQKHLITILDNLSKIVTQPLVAVHVLEFLTLLARVRKVYSNFREQDYKMVFGISFAHLRRVFERQTPASTRDDRATAPSDKSPLRHKMPLSQHSARDGQESRQDGSAPAQSSRLKSIMTVIENKSEASKSMMEFPQYVYALAYHVITFWFMCLKLEDRSKYVDWICDNLVHRDAEGREVVDDQGEVTIDMLHRVAFSDVDELLPEKEWATDMDGPVSVRSWLLGHSILTVETAATSGLSKIVRRQPSGTSHYIVRARRAPLRPHQQSLSLADPTELENPMRSAAGRTLILPEHIFSQLRASGSYRDEERSPSVMLPGDGRTTKLLEMFDLNPTVDSHKIGVIYVGPDQARESEILANDRGSADYTLLLERLGVLVRLKGANFNTQGLDKSDDSDGRFTISWRDRVTELIFHVATLMPNDPEYDPLCTQKKKHVGNDFVNIIYNDSSGPISFAMFPSAFNFVNIIITPETHSAPEPIARTHHEMSRQMYNVRVRTKEGMPDITAAAESKLVSMTALPTLVRLLAINASVFSLVWHTRAYGEHVSSWRNRLREIKKMEQSCATPSSSASSEQGGVKEHAHPSISTLLQVDSAAPKASGCILKGKANPSVDSVPKRSSASVYLQEIRGSNG